MEYWSNGVMECWIMYSHKSHYLLLPLDALSTPRVHFSVPGSDPLIASVLIFPHIPLPPGPDITCIPWIQIFSF